MEHFDDLDSKAYKESSHEQSSDDTPEENTVLILRGDLEIWEYHQEHEEIIDTERFLNHIGRDELDSRLMAEPEIHNTGERERYCYPDDTPGDGFSSADCMCFFVKNTEIDCEHDGYDYKESYPEKWLCFHYFLSVKIGSTLSSLKLIGSQNHQTTAISKPINAKQIKNHISRSRLKCAKR